MRETISRVLWCVGILGCFTAACVEIGRPRVSGEGIEKKEEPAGVSAVAGASPTGDVALTAAAKKRDEPCPTADKLPKSLKEGKKIWAYNYLWAKAPELVVEKWLSKKPDIKGKYVLYQFWSTWCPPCRRSIGLLNRFQKKFSGEDIVFIGICDCDEEAIAAMPRKYPGTEEIEYCSAVDTRARMKDELGVFGVPHIIIVEPEHGCVIWQGFPFLKDYELTGKTIEKILEIGKKTKATKKQ